MYKILVVDDERIEREGLRLILQRGYPNLMIEEASSGNAAIEWVRRFQPDLVLMDIKMPGITGLEAIQIIAEENPWIRFIMVTAFDTFEYARQAIKLGVKDYLLKPSKAREIVATVSRVLEQIGEERLYRSQLSSQQAAMEKTIPLIETDIVTQLLFDHVHDIHLQELLDLIGESSSNEMFAVQITLSENKELLYRAVKKRLKNACSCWVGAMCGLQIPVFVFRRPDRSFRAQAVDIAQEILRVASPSKEGWFVGIGGVCSSLHDSKQSFQEALLSSIHTTTSAVKYRFYEDLPVINSVREILNREQERQLLDHIRLGRWKQVLSSVMELIRSFEQEQIPLIQAQQRILEVLWLTTRILSELGIMLPAPMYTFQAQDYRQFCTETLHILQHLEQAYEQFYQHASTETIHTMKQYIFEHSHENISLDMISRQVGLNPFYISKLFKEQLGINYIDFLTECRIERSKQLMLDPNKSMKEITFEVGYHDPNYFSKVFKKSSGQSPTEYRKALLQGNEEKPENGSTVR
ncbi:response regulator [Paenibacillus sp. F411]|uniref:response regulator n=1 Tax=Paenibacillus sp. F411 TaxID=2820239 RepID=UPI001AAF479F|nr:response regulator [Paenibacillus sp. F411]MBO2943501.1 response regulator [Paenibacillus sp. F411]